MARQQKASFKLQIVHPDGSPLTFLAGRRFERDLVTDITEAVVRNSSHVVRDAIVKRGVGILRTEARVMGAIDEGLNEVLADIVKESVEGVLYALKYETVE